MSLPVPQPSAPATNWLRTALARDRESGRVFVVGVLTYLSPSIALRIGHRWFPELANPSEWLPRYHVLRRKLWAAFAKTVGTAIAVVGALALLGRGIDAPEEWLRVVAAIGALTATLARGGWDIQSFKGATLVERIDRGMYYVGQLGAFALLLLIMGW